ncbi:MAG: methylmalonyl-CoA mutase [Deltaproteobacteria bacterium]|nr:methylmalonyl-CoA mutase [Deltaproteobacteria bacterium]
MSKKESHTTPSGIPVELCYTPEHWKADQFFDRDLGLPGHPPYTRGIHPTLYRGKLWTMRQYAGFGTAAESNRRYRYLLQQGQTGLSVAFDLPTQMGYDSDHLMSRGEVGKVGVAIDSLEDMETLLNGIPLEKVSTSMTINATAAILLALYIAAAEKQGADKKLLRGTVQNDILKEYIARGTYIYPPKPSLRLVADIFEYCQRELPQWNTISVSGYHIREAGATAVQEIAFTLANGLLYLNTAVSKGLDVDETASRISFFFNVHNEFLEEIAKFRAARRLWERLLREKLKSKDPSARKLRFHAQTAGSTLTAQQIDNNIVRVALQALAAVFGGAQSLHTNSKDEALGLPAEEAVLTALRTQQIIAHETGVPSSVDPLGGSFALESLTNELERRALDYLHEIERRGGVLSALEEGYFQKEISDASYAYQKEIEAKERIIVGVNAFQTGKERENKSEPIHADPKLEALQIEKVRALKKRRNNAQVEQKLSDLEKAARNERENLMPFILEAVKTYATLGEISDRLRTVFGVYHEKSLF